METPSTEDVTRLLDQESTAILNDLQDALDAVELDESIRSMRSKYSVATSMDGGDPASQEHELFMLMDSLVAELRADLQNQAVDDFGMLKEPDELGLDLTISAALQPPRTLDNSSGNDPQQQQQQQRQRQSTTSTTDAYGASAAASVSAAAYEYDDDDNYEFDVPLEDFTQEAIEGLTPTQKDLLQRLRHHMLRQDQQQQLHTLDEDRVYQEIPDFVGDRKQKHGDDDVHFEKLSTALEGDPDYVPVQDFTKKAAADNKRTASQENAKRINNYYNARHHQRPPRHRVLMEKLARGRVWKRICQIVFQRARLHHQQQQRLLLLADGSSSSLTTPSTHRTRLVE